ERRAAAVAAAVRSAGPIAPAAAAGTDAAAADRHAAADRDADADGFDPVADGHGRTVEGDAQAAGGDDHHQDAAEAAQRPGHELSRPPRFARPAVCDGPVGGTADGPVTTDEPPASYGRLRRLRADQRSWPSVNIDASFIAASA